MKVVFRKACSSDALTLAYWDTLPHIKASDPYSAWEWKSELDTKYPWKQQWIAVADRVDI
jgi:hypothetical protein